MKGFFCYQIFILLPMNSTPSSSISRRQYNSIFDGLHSFWNIQVSIRFIAFQTKAHLLALLVAEMSWWTFSQVLFITHYFCFFFSFFPKTTVEYIQNWVYIQVFCGVFSTHHWKNVGSIFSKIHYFWSYESFEILFHLYTALSSSHCF